MVFRHHLLFPWELFFNSQGNISVSIMLYRAKQTRLSKYMCLYMRPDPFSELMVLWLRSKLARVFVRWRTGIMNKNKSFDKALGTASAPNLHKPDLFWELNRNVSNAIPYFHGKRFNPATFIIHLKLYRNW